MLIKSQATTLLQIFCELSFYTQVISKGMRLADDTFQSTSECEWVNCVFGALSYRYHRELNLSMRKDTSCHIWPGEGKLDYLLIELQGTHPPERHPPGGNLQGR